MILQNNKGTGKQILKCGSRILQNGVSWNIKSKGMTFPYNQKITNSSSQLIIQFSSASSIRVNYGDGTLITYNSTSNQIVLNNMYNSFTGVSTLINTYTYSSGDENTIRNISITINEPSKVTLVNISFLISLVSQPVPIKFTPLINLKNLILGSTLAESIDESYLLLPDIQLLSFVSAFNSSSRYYGQIPLDVLTNKKYTSFSYSGSSFGGKPFNESNLDKIVPNLKNTLQTLQLTGNGLTDSDGLPANFSDLTLLTNLSIVQNYTHLPAVINTLTNLRALNLTNGGSYTYLNNISNLINLTNLSLLNCGGLAAPFPEGFGNLTKLKVLTFTGCGNRQPQNPDVINQWIAFFYTCFTTFGAMTGGSSDPFRNMTINMSANNPETTPTKIPSGSYQAPSGFLLGISNGTPVSSLERIWVLVNQYNHIWTYRTA